ncbi:hypothetical protein TRFO_33109 [Tritrichomonas foetus]|uniref:Uncharacterized protein n=1 Tax=Tritrichomonas foetus TaxID=1144522 RepID=A0A1J4JSL4_9EUKA|nr:hypothetical protein TRFO_33109 [Tritrichomonas foetus]|eukprot:OHT00237.1 hypothetical protein TRFO_33109 [Tritrichomonas foetus]
MQASDDDYDIHIVVAAKIFAKCFTAEISDSFLLPLVNKENPMLNYFDFLRRATDFFGEKHKIIFSQTRDLLWICGCLDPQYIGFDTFVAFVTFLDYDCDMRKEWKSIMSISEKHENNTITIGDLMGYLADRKQQFLRLLNLIPMGKSILTLKSYSTIINDLFLDLMNRFIRVKRQAKSKLSQAINDKIHRYLIDLKQSILCADLPRILWFYRTILLKIDKNLMKEKGSIPFNSKANSEVIKQLVEYYDRTESVAFALM